MITRVLPVGMLSHRDSDALQRFAKGHDGHFLQCLGFRAATDNAVSLVAISESNDEIVAYSLIQKTVARLPLFEKWYIDRGPVFRDGDALHGHLRSIIGDRSARRMLWLRVEPWARGNRLSQFLKAVGGDGLRTHRSEWNRNYNRTVEVGLTLDLEGLKSRFSASLRRQLKKAANSRVIYRALTEQTRTLQFSDAYNEFAERRGLPVLGVGWLAALVRQSEESEICRTRVYEAVVDNQLVAGIVVVYTRDTAFYHWGFSSERVEYRKLPLSHALHWLAIKDACRAGLSIYDFGGFDSTGERVSEISRFKCQFSKTVVDVSLPVICFEKAYLVESFR